MSDFFCFKQMQLVDRIEKLSRAGLKEPTGDKIILLLEKYYVVVPKEVPYDRSTNSISSCE